MTSIRTIRTIRTFRTIITILTFHDSAIGTAGKLQRVPGPRGK